MAKIHTRIGFSNSVEVTPGVWEDQPTEREYYGEVIRQARQWQNTSQVNDNLVLNNRITVVSDDFASSNFSTMRYIIWGGVYWKISNVEIDRPRFILTLGGVYNGPKA